MQRRLAHTQPLARVTVAVLTCVALTTTGCETEEKVVRYKPFLSGLQDVKTGQQAVMPSSANAVQDPDADRVVRVLPGGKKVVNAKTVRQLMSTLESLLDANEDELIFDQIVSDETKQYLRGEGYNPKDYVDHLHDIRRDIGLMLARMPLGEHSPTVAFEPIGNKQYVVKLLGAAAKDLTLTKIWVVMDRGNYRLVWLS